MSDDELRTAVGPALEESAAPNMQHILDEFIANGKLAIALGKAFYWDEAAGSDGQACASCHFHAGADNRSKNQLNPGINANDMMFESPTRSGGIGGPNYQLVDDDFGDLGVPKDFNDVISSMGVHNTSFDSVQFFDDTDVCTSVPDIFNVHGTNTRRVEPRNTPTVINAVFNHRNFWDGRANNIFNGVTPLGRRSNVKHPLSDPDGGVGVWRVPSFPAPPFAVKEQITVKNSSLASQAVGPGESNFEMSCLGRKFPMIGRKMLPRRALAGQTVSFTDSHFSNVPPFGNLVRADGDGLKFTYAQLVRMAIKPEWWRAFGLVDGEFTQMQANFSLYWGLTVQLYEAKLISHETPFDTFVRNIEPNADDALTEDQKRGLEVFLGDGKCINCHVAPEFTGATVRLRALQPDGNEEGMERMNMGDFQRNPENNPAVYDGGFYNIGVRGTQEDLCVGGVQEDFPISFSRQASTGMIVDDEAKEDPAVDEEDPDIPQGPVQPGERVAVDGACKVPGLRNAELTGPFFHNGGAATLKQAVLMYQDQFRSLFSLDNIDDLDPDILEIDIDDDEVEPLVAFLRSLTDERVRLHAAPFDHPSITLFNGHITNLDGTVNDVDGNFRADDNNNFVLDAVGAVGFPAAPLPNFLDNCTELDPNHADFTDC